MTNLKIYAMANMVNNGAPFMVYQYPDYNGGHQITIGMPDYELQNFEYCNWYGTPKQFAEENPMFTEHFEPAYEEPKDETITAEQLLRWYLNR